MGAESTQVQMSL